MIIESGDLCEPPPRLPEPQPERDPVRDMFGQAIHVGDYVVTSVYTFSVGATMRLGLVVEVGVATWPSIGPRPFVAMKSVNRLDREFSRPTYNTVYDPQSVVRFAAEDIPKFFTALIGCPVDPGSVD